MSFFQLPGIRTLREIAGAFEDASIAIRIELELNGGEGITREAL